jgi:prolyl-tRNA synthetase
MKLTKYFIPMLKDSPSDAKIKSHILMLRAGLIQKTASGIYSWLPYGLEVLKNIENIIADEQKKAGNLQVLMSTIQSADLWKESGRYDAYGSEMLRITDRHSKDLLYSPTNEEQITNIFKTYVKTYNDLPKNFFQIQWKFRDEIRPRFGVMRGREFFMKDGYSFDLDEEGARKTYENVYETYVKTFRRMGLQVMTVRADSGAIGGNLSHEFHVLADTGESGLFYDNRVNYETISCSDLINTYAVSDEKHDPSICPVPEEFLSTKRGIEVGHIFYFGRKYTESADAYVLGPDGKKIYPEMGSYGIGVSRLVGAAIESSHDERGIIWPEEISPFKYCIINIHQGKSSSDEFSEDVYNSMISLNQKVLYDDRNERAGVKRSCMELIGIPFHIIISEKLSLEKNIELINRKTGEVQILSFESFCKGVYSNEK